MDMTLGLTNLIESESCVRFIFIFLKNKMENFYSSDEMLMNTFSTISIITSKVHNFQSGLNQSQHMVPRDD